MVIVVRRKRQPAPDMQQMPLKLSAWQGVT
jgi:hypothetical protein